MSFLIAVVTLKLWKGTERQHAWQGGAGLMQQQLPAGSQLLWQETINPALPRVLKSTVTMGRRETDAVQLPGSTPKAVQENSRNTTHCQAPGTTHQDTIRLQLSAQHPDCPTWTINKHTSLGMLRLPPSLGPSCSWLSTKSFSRKL